MALTKVSSSLVSDNAITTGKLVDGGVHSADIADVAVTSAKIANNAILTQHIDDAQVTTDQLGADAVTAAKIADNAVSEEHLDITVITSLTAVTAATGDLLMVADVSDSNNLKKIPVSSILAGTLTNAAQTNITSVGSLTALDVAGTATMDGLTVSNTGVPQILIQDLDGTDKKTTLKHSNGTSVILSQNNFSHGTTLLQSSNGTTTLTRQKIASNGDISFYEDTGSTAKLFWDASDERLTLTGPDYQFGIKQGSNQPWYNRAVSDGSYRIHLNGTGDILTANSAGINVTGNIGVTGTVDGIDIAARDAVLTSTTTTAGAALPKAGGTMTGPLIVDTDTEHQIKIDASSSSGASMHINSAGGYAYTVYQNSDRIWRLGAYGGSSFTIRDHTGSTTPLLIDSSGNVGIGESTPLSNLHVIGNVGVEGLNKLQYFVPASATSIGTSVPAQHWIGRIDSAGYHMTTNEGGFAGVAGTLGIAGKGGIAFATSSNTATYASGRMIITAAGNVGIGTANPGEKLEVNGVLQIKRVGDHPAIRFVEDTTTRGYIGSGDWAINGLAAADFGISSVGALALGHSGGVERMRIHTNGNVGIGAPAPTEKLEVDGGIKISNGNSRLYFGTEGGTSYRALEGSTNGSLLQVGENYTDIALQGNVGIGLTSPAYSLDLGGAMRIAASRSTFVDASEDATAAAHIFVSNDSVGDFSQLAGNLVIQARTHTSVYRDIIFAGGINAASDLMTIKGEGNVVLADGATAFEQIRPFFGGANASSYSDSTNLAYTKSADEYSITGEHLKARVRARAYTKYVHMKTNLTSDNIMFFFRIYGYFYNNGVNECVRGGYTYNGGVIAEGVQNAYNSNSNYTIGDFYRSSTGNFLCIRLDVHHTGYTEGEALVFFGSHSSSVTRTLQITDMQHRDDGSNAY